jgi:hypothetical protein
MRAHVLPRRPWQLAAVAMLPIVAIVYAVVYVVSTFGRRFAYGITAIIQTILSAWAR